MIKLHVGCGDVILPGYINLDARPGPMVDVVGEARTLDEIPLRSIDVIYASCLLEHFGHRETVDVLRAWKERLRPGGTVRISVPSFEAIVQEYQSNGGDIGALMGLLIGGQKNDYDFHGAIFDYALLKDSLEAAGFSDVQHYDWRDYPEHAENDDYSRAYLPHMDQRGRHMSLNVMASATAYDEICPRWYVIGDSHSWVFTKTNAHPGLFEKRRWVFSPDGEIAVNYIDPWLAWSLGREERMHQLEKALGYVPEGARVVLAFGEIDCRCHIVTQARETRRSLREVSEEVAGKMFEAAQRLASSRSLRVYLWNAPPPTGGPIYNKEAPIVGSYQERRQATEHLNRRLAELAASSRSIEFLSIYGKLVHGDRTKTSLFRDYVHLHPERVRAYVEQELMKHLVYELGHR